MDRGLIIYIYLNSNEGREDTNKRREKPKPFLGEVGEQKLEFYNEFTVVALSLSPLNLVCMTLRPVCVCVFCFSI